MRDEVLLDDWHPVIAGTQLAPGTRTSVRLLDLEIVVWRGADGVVHAWEDRCPHRGTRLSIGRVEGDELVCAYHGWRFAGTGQCTTFPALPDVTPPATAYARVYSATERYGLVWVCVGDAPAAVLSFPEYDDPHLRKVVCGAYAVNAGGPRIVEILQDQPTATRMGRK